VAIGSVNKRNDIAVMTSRHHLGSSGGVAASIKRRLKYAGEAAANRRLIIEASKAAARNKENAMRRA